MPHLHLHEKDLLKDRLVDSILRFIDQLNIFSCASIFSKYVVMIKNRKVGSWKRDCYYIIYIHLIDTWFGMVGGGGVAEQLLYTVYFTRATLVGF
jgi:hypothetical protein